MALKNVTGTELKIGTNILIDGEPYTVSKIDLSKTGKHGAMKCRIEAKGMIKDSKKVLVCPGHEKFEVPMVDKRKGQILSMTDTKISIMDLESFETIDLDCPEEIKNELSENSSVEYWDIEGRKVVKRKI